MQAMHEADHSPASSAKVKKEPSYTTILHVFMVWHLTQLFLI